MVVIIPSVTSGFFLPACPFLIPFPSFLCFLLCPRGLPSRYRCISARNYENHGRGPLITGSPYAVRKEGAGAVPFRLCSYRCIVSIHRQNTSSAGPQNGLRLIAESLARCVECHTAFDCSALFSHGLDVKHRSDVVGSTAEAG